MKRKVYRGRISFTKAELLCLSMNTGMMIGSPVVGDSKEEMKAMRASFGWVGSIPANNNNNYFGGKISSAKDLIPKPEDYVVVPYRLLSATIVGGGSWKATDFGNAAELEKSTPLLDGKSVYKNHEYDDINNAAGFISEPKWQASFTNKDGHLVPPGINGLVNIDAMTESKLARNVLSGAVYSNSVTIEFDWTMSHDFKDEDEFMMSCGTVHKDGRMVCRKMHKIHNYHESSMCFLGADPFAKMINPDGSLRNIDTTGIVEFSKADPKEKEEYEKSGVIKDELKIFSSKFRGFEVDAAVVSFAKEHVGKKYVISNNKTKTEDMEWLANLKKTLKLADDAEVTQADIAKLTLVDPSATANAAKALVLDAIVGGVEIAALDKDDTTKVTLTDNKLPDSFKADEYVMVKKADLNTFKTEAATNKTKAAIGDSFLAEQRKEAVRLYKVAVGGEDKADAAVLGLFNKATVEELNGLLKQYTKTVKHSFSGKCGKCGSEEFEFRSSFSTPAPDETGKSETHVPTMDNIREKYGKSTMTIGRRS